MTKVLLLFAVKAWIVWISFLVLTTNKVSSTNSKTESCYPKRKKQIKRILLIGDSITEYSQIVENNGWGALLSSRYVRSADVLNRGFAGYNTRWIKFMLPQILPNDNFNREDYILATILLGSNDCTTRQQHIPLPEYKRNIVTIINYLKSKINQNIKIILITPPPIDFDKGWKERASVTYYADVVKNIGNEMHIPVINLWGSTLDIKIDTKINPKADLIDGLHLSKSGNGKLFLAIQAVISTKFPKLDPINTYYGPSYKALQNISYSRLECKKLIESAVML